MQIAYNKTNIKLNYLSCYVNFWIKDKTISFVNTVFDTNVTLTGELNDIKLLVDDLSKGVTTNKILIDLKSFSNDNEILYIHLLKEHIIE